MIKLITSCDDCDHYKICKNVEKPNILYKQLRLASVNDFGMDVEIGCPDWKKSIVLCEDERIRKLGGR